MNVRVATHNDFDKMIEIKLGCVKKMHEGGNTLQYTIAEDSYPSRLDFRNRIKFNDLYVVELDGEVSGFYFLETKDESEFIRLGYTNTNTIHMVFVDINKQGKGIAKAMCQHAISKAKENNADYITIDTHPTNKPMLALSEKMGGKFIGELWWDRPKNEKSLRYGYAIKL